MSLEQLPHNDKAKEREAEPKVLFTFYGYNHGSLNLQGIHGILDTFSRHLETHGGKKVLYIESAEDSTEDAIARALKVNNQGFRGVLLEAILSEIPGIIIPSNNAIEELSYKIEHFANNDVKRILDLELLPIDEIHPYFLFAGLDQLRAKHNFDVVFESHSQEVLRKGAVLSFHFSRFASKVREEWNKGHFNNSLRAAKSALSWTHQDDLLRELDMTEQLRNLTQSLMDQEKGGSLFALVGRLHTPVVEKVSRNLGTAASIRYRTNEGANENMQEEKIDEGMRSGDLASDEVYMQSYMVIRVWDELQRNSVKSGTISTLANNYESYSHSIATIASGISLAQGRRLCVRHTPLLEFFIKQQGNLGVQPSLLEVCRMSNGK